jgi:hypothetical protein
MERDVILTAELVLGQAALAIAMDDLGPMGSLVGGSGPRVVPRGDEVRWLNHRDEASEFEDGVYRTHTSARKPVRLFPSRDRGAVCMTDPIVRLH